MVLYDCIALCMVSIGPVQFYTFIYGHVWSNMILIMVFYGPVCLYGYMYGSVWFFMVLYDIFSCLLVLYHTTKCLFLISTKYSYSSVDIKGINLKSQPTNGPLRNVMTSFILVAKYLLQCPNCSILVHPSPPSVISGVNCIILFI